MNKKTFYQIRLSVTGIVAMAIWILLAWNDTHGGVPSHHILANKNLPSISNWWGGFLLPLLTWFLLYCIQKRIIRNNDEHFDTRLPKVIYGFVGSLLYGILLSVRICTWLCHRYDLHIWCSAANWHRKYIGFNNRGAISICATDNIVYCIKIFKYC